ncbi:hypothetical protein BDW62DRAFT_198893 [Aspergillus aurantiobrunneus]
MALTPHQALSIVIIIYYVPSLIPTSFLLRRHSIGKAWGWLYLFIFAIFRVTGASLQIASDSVESNGLGRAAAMFASIGVMTLLLAMLELIENVKTTFDSDPIHRRIWTLLHLSQYAAFTLSVVFTFTSQDSLSHAAAVIVTCLFSCQTLICIVFYIRLRSNSAIHHYTGDDDKHQNPQADSKKMKILLLALASTPFLTVRALYLLLSTFANSPDFKGRDLDGDGDGDGDTPANVYVVAFMQYLMESIVFAIFVFAGFAMPSLREAKEVEKEEESKVSGDGSRG